MQRKLQKIFFDFEIIVFELVPLDSRFTQREYLLLGVKILTNSLKISVSIKTEFFELIYCRANSSSISDTLTC